MPKEIPNHINRRHERQSNRMREPLEPIIKTIPAMDQTDDHCEEDNLSVAPAMDQTDDHCEEGNLSVAPAMDLTVSIRPYNSIFTTSPVTSTKKHTAEEKAPPLTGLRTQGEIETKADRTSENTDFTVSSYRG
ncbi:MAG: hypothetical protein P1U63_06830 [Coxiellaceae bacterium]|nr:hypothetical protein [Coxiellaceae bacterium]